MHYKYFEETMLGMTWEEMADAAMKDILQSI